MKPSSRSSLVTRHSLLSCEAEVVPGLEEFGRQELERRFGARVEALLSHKPGNIPFLYTGELRDLLTLRTVGSVFLVRDFDIPRPLALLGHQNFQALLGLTREAMGLHPPGAFRTFRISAAGEGSSVFDRLRTAIHDSTGLLPAEDGDLLIRIRRSPWGSHGFEVSVRLSPRPLSARPWRVCDMPGALNATVARVMVELTRPSPDDSYLNLVCGSGTLLIERLDGGPAARALGVDTSPAALGCARENVRAAGLKDRVELECWDATRLPLSDGAASALVADLPFGHLVGTHSRNEELYPGIIAEAARVARAGARFVAITTEARLMDRVLSAHSFLWRTDRVFPIRMDGTRLRIYALVRR